MAGQSFPTKIYITAHTREGNEHILPLDSLPQTVFLHSEYGPDLELVIPWPTSAGGGQGAVVATDRMEYENGGSVYRGVQTGKRDRPTTPLVAEVPGEATRASASDERTAKRCCTERSRPSLSPSSSVASSSGLTSRCDSGFLRTDADVNEGWLEQAVEAAEKVQAAAASRRATTSIQSNMG